MWSRIKSIMARPYKIELVKWITFERSWVIDVLNLKKMYIYENF